MVPILAFTLTVLIGHTIFAAELNIPYLNNVVDNEISKSVKVNLNLGSAFKGVDKSTFAATAKILPVQLDKVGTGLKQNIVLLSSIIVSLRLSNNNKSPGNVYVSEKTLNDLEQDIANAIKYFQNLYTLNAAFNEEFQENAKNIHLDANGSFNLPPNVGPELMSIKAQLAKNFHLLSVSCQSLQNILHQIALSIKSQSIAGAQLFEDASVAFAVGATAFAKVADTVHIALVKFIALGMNIENETLHIPANKFIHFLNTEMNGIGTAIEEMADKVNSVGNQLPN